MSHLLIRILNNNTLVTYLHSYTFINLTALVQV